MDGAWHGATATHGGSDPDLGHAAQRDEAWYRATAAHGTGERNVVWSAKAPRRRSAASLAALLLFACSARTPASPPDSVLWPPGAIALPERATVDLPFAPDPDLQVLVDPHPNENLPAWAGADVASSIEIGPERWVWLFGDTLLGRITAPCPGGERYCGRAITETDEADLLRNSLGLAERGWFGQIRPVETWWRREAAASTARAALASPDSSSFLWPLSGAAVNGALLIAANRHTPASGLEPVGNVLVRIANPGDPPAAWVASVRAIPGFVAGVPGGAPQVSWTTAVVPAGEWVHLVGARGVGPTAETVLARVRAERASAGADALDPQFLMCGADGRPLWSADFDPARLCPLPGLPGTSEATFEGHAGLGWVSFRIPPFTFEIRLYTASNLLGPWHDRGVVYRLPAPWSTTALVGCGPAASAAERATDCLRPVFVAYAVKSHPELAPAGGFALSYNGNLAAGDLEQAIEAADHLPAFYVPQMLSGPGSFAREP